MCFEFYEPETIKFSLVSTVKKFLRLVYDFIDQLLSSRHEELEPLKIGNKKIHSKEWCRIGLTRCSGKIWSAVKSKTSS